MFTPWQRAYLAHSLSLVRGNEQVLTRTMVSARVDMNPHQVDAALFALRSPLAQGVLLADEVGLGKTIEASLVLAQRWAEKRRRLLLIVPATLRKQWAQELADKFELPTRILEARNFNEARKRGIGNPFDAELAFDEPALLICSYEFASRKASELKAVPWDLVVFDEAHKLRNSYRKEGAKQAHALRDALEGCSKLLLSATPLQNSLMELYGLVSIMDPHFFGDLEAFRARYARPRLSAEELAQLRSRMRSICQRTLRQQVQEEGGIKFTRRYSVTESFDPSADEQQLYELVSGYLQDDSTLAIKPQARQLVALVIRKILASSSHAIMGTLQRMIDRLEKRQALAAALAEDYEELDDLTDSAGLDEEDFADPLVLQAEIAELQMCMQLASAIERDAKAEALLRVLGRAFESAERLGGPRKAVIFTESVRTQSKLFELLTATGYAGEVVLLNGSNTDPESRKTLQDWRKRHAGSSRLSGSQSADMKAALVERFRDQASIMICTEAGSEGINLQFCSLLINYDLPWNPQRVEQRIGRVHRYGQKHDVVVVNFINNANLADRRVFQLLSQKFQLFEGVFGASDEILGAIASGMDIEMDILRIYQQCRTEEEINREFDALQARLQEQIDSRNQEARQALLDNFDVDVVQRLATRRERASMAMSSYQRELLCLVRMSLPDVQFDDGRFCHDGEWHDLDWQRAEQQGGSFFHPTSGLASELIEAALRDCPEHSMAELRFFYQAQNDGQFADIQTLIGCSGELAVEKLSICTASQCRELLLLAAVTDDGQTLEDASIQRLLLLPAESLGVAPALHQEAALQDMLDQLFAQQQIITEQDNAHWFEEESDKLDRWAEDKRLALNLRIEQLDLEIREARKAVRQQPTLQEKMQAKKALQKLERERDSLMLDYHAEKKRIEAEEDRLLEEIAEKLQVSEQRQRLFTLRWRLEDAS